MHIEYLTAIYNVTRVSNTRNEPIIWLISTSSQRMISLLRDHNLKTTERDSGSGARSLPGQTADRVTMMCFLPSGLCKWSSFVEWMLVARDSNEQFVGAR
jgi:hypothetical protein